MDRELPATVRRRHRLKQLLRLVVGAAAALGLLVWLTGMLKPTLKRARIRTATVERGALEAVITAAGTVQPANEQAISSPIETRILRVLHQPGAVLEAGEPILELDTTQAALDLKRIEEKIQQTEQRRRELELDTTLNDLRSRREIQQLDVEQLDYQLQQTRQLFEQGLAAELALRRIETQVKKARIEVRNLEESLRGAAQAQQAQLEGIASELRTLERDRREAERRLERASPSAERAGVLTWVADEEGATVRAGEVIARLAELDRFRVEATVSDVHANRLAPGQPVRVPLDGEELRGSIDRILPAIDQGVVRFWVALEEPGDDLLHANLRVDVLVVTERRGEVLKIRKGPFVNGTGPQEVFVVRGKAAERRSVRLGLSGYDHYEVLDGLALGEEVVVSEVERYLHLEEIDIR
ncbi:MAG: HlyD family efflux transporter periplasmic adaptor subunit [bacterium]|nr:HlyD family efflux transporter periplasmic adaptor subunit [bacterium]